MFRSTIVHDVRISFRNRCGHYRESATAGFYKIMNVLAIVKPIHSCYN